MFLKNILKAVCERGLSISSVFLYNSRICFRFLEIKDLTLVQIISCWNNLKHKMLNY